MRAMLASLAIILSLAAVDGARAQSDVGALLARSLGAGAIQSVWLPNRADPARATEAVGIVYIPIAGAAGNVDISAGLFTGGPSGFGFAGPISGLFGASPREAAFLADRIELTTTMPKPGDPRCCPTGTARWSIDRGTRAATRIR